MCSPATRTRAPSTSSAGGEPDHRGGARGGAVVELGTPVEAILAINRDDFKRVKRGTRGRGFDARDLVRIGSHAQLGP